MRAWLKRKDIGPSVRKSNQLMVLLTGDLRAVYHGRYYQLYCRTAGDWSCHPDHCLVLVQVQCILSSDPTFVSRDGLEPYACCVHQRERRGGAVICPSRFEL